MLTRKFKKKKLYEPLEIIYVSGSPKKFFFLNIYIFIYMKAMNRGRQNPTDPTNPNCPALIRAVFVPFFMGSG
jgi:hypothetical protein